MPIGRRLLETRLVASPGRRRIGGMKNNLSRYPKRRYERVVKMNPRRISLDSDNYCQDFVSVFTRRMYERSRTGAEKSSSTGPVRISAVTSRPPSADAARAS